MLIMEKVVLIFIFWSRLAGVDFRGIVKKEILGIK